MHATMPILFKKIHPGAKIPQYMTSGASGADLCCIEDIYFPHPGSIVVAGTGLTVAIPRGHELQIRSRSGLAARGIFVLNSPGTIDSDYRGEIKVILGCFGSNSSITLPAGTRIAQAVCTPIVIAEYIEAECDLPGTTRGVRGLGSTGER